jgi:hypothetical protein
MNCIFPVLLLTEQSSKNRMNILLYDKTQSTVAAVPSQQSSIILPRINKYVEGKINKADVNTGVHIH